MNDIAKRFSENPLLSPADLVTERRRPSNYLFAESRCVSIHEQNMADSKGS